MPTAISRDDVRALLAHGAQLVGVLLADEYADQHLPRAINVWLRELNAETTAPLRRDRRAGLSLGTRRGCVIPRAQREGVPVPHLPEDQPWGTRELAVTESDGNRLNISTRLPPDGGAP